MLTSGMQRPYQVCPQRGHLSALPVALTGSDWRNGSLKSGPAGWWGYLDNS